MKRREFLTLSSASLLAGGTTRRSWAGPEVRQIGLGLFSIPNLLEKDFRQGMAFVASLGYSKVEPFGPYDFSDSAQIEQWKSLKPVLGFGGSGFFGLTAKEARASFDENHLTAPSMHTDLVTLQTKMAALADAAHIIGATYLVLPAIPEERRKTLDDYRRMADVFNSVGEQAKHHGLRFAYHNHGYGLHEMDGQIPLKVIFKNTDPSLVFLEMDVYWTVAGGADPVALLKEYPTRYKMMHLKDMQERKRFSGDGGSVAQWTELFPYMTTIGDGVIDIKAIVAQAKTIGVEHLFVEQDKVAQPEVALKRSADYLLKL